MPTNLSDEDLVRAYRGLKDGVPVTVNKPHVEALRRVLKLVAPDSVGEYTVGTKAEVTLYGVWHNIVAYNNGHGWWITAHEYGPEGAQRIEHAGEDVSNIRVIDTLRAKG